MFKAIVSDVLHQHVSAWYARNYFSVSRHSFIEDMSTSLIIRLYLFTRFRVVAPLIAGKPTAHGLVDAKCDDFHRMKTFYPSLDRHYQRAILSPRETAQAFYTNIITDIARKVQDDRIDASIATLATACPDCDDQEVGCGRCQPAGSWA